MAHIVRWGPKRYAICRSIPPVAWKPICPADLSLQETHYQHMFVALWLLLDLAHYLIKPEKLARKKGGSTLTH